MGLDKMEVKEKELYTTLYKTGYPETGYVGKQIKFIELIAERGMRLLEIGCGHGRLVKTLRKQGWDCTGVDITLGGIEGSTRGFVSNPVWNMNKLKDKNFDFSFSFDVLEHIPLGYKQRAIEEIYRVTLYETFHTISTRMSIYEPGLHKTVQRIISWRKDFDAGNKMKVQTFVIDSDDFDTLYYYVVRRNTNGY